jgi:tetratricopeptide (TPR) repeat protein
MIEAVENEHPKMVRLAEAVSLAVIVDPPLLRRARLALVPGADVGVEADLWLSPFVQSRSLDGLVFHQNVAEELRTRLAESPERLQRAWEMTASLHRHFSPALRAEEEIAWLSVCSDPEAPERIQDLLRSVLTALMNEERRGIARWAARALPKMPSKARITKEAKMLEVGAQLRLNGAVHPMRLGAQIPDWLPWVIPEEFPRTPVGVRLLPGAIELDGAGAREGNILQLPRTKPLWVEVSWTDQDDKHSVQTIFRVGEKVIVPMPVDQAQFRIISGEIYQLRRIGTPAQDDRIFISYAGADRPWAEWIAWTLEAVGLSAVIQTWDFRPGSNFVVEMQKAVAGSDRTIAVLSPDYPRSLYAMAEWAAVFATDPDGAKGKLVPVKVREVALEDLLTTIIHVNLVGLGEAAAREALLSGLAPGRTRPESVRFPGAHLFPGPTLSPPVLDPDKANAILQDLPLDEVPQPGPLPLGSRMPLAPNPLFVGREEDLKTLARQLKAGETSAVGQVQIAAATGLGGIGKTQLASEFVHRYGRFFAGGVFWMSFADPGSVSVEVAACGRGLDLRSSFDALTLEQQVRLVEEAWQSQLPRLLVFDSCEEEKLLFRWRPLSGGARILITSRRAEWDQALGVRTTPLTTLPRSASIELLNRFRPDILRTDPALDGIAGDLGDLPLALHLAGNFLQTYRASSYGQPTAYLEALRRADILAHPSLQGRGAGILPTRHEGHLGRAFALSFERLDSNSQADTLAIALLARAAWFAPGEPIPRSLLLKTVHANSEDLATVLLVEDALRRLTDLGLIEINNGNNLLMHALVAAWAHEVAQGNEARVAVEDAVLLEARRLNETGNPALLLAWQPHLRMVTNQAMEREDWAAAALCDEFGSHLWQAGEYSRARPYLEKAVAGHVKVAGAEHPDTANSLNNLGRLLYSQGDYSAARLYYEQGLAIREKVLGQENPSTANSLNNLGSLLQDLGDFGGSRSYLERALAIQEKVLGPEHPDTAISLNNLGLLLQHQGDFSEARPYLERALTIQEKVLGQEHPNTTLSLSSLGSLLQDQGNSKKARTYFERALKIREKALGPEHPDTAVSLNNLGVLLQKQGDLTAARRFYERALTIFDKRLGPNHPHTKGTRTQLASLKSETGT